MSDAREEFGAIKAALEGDGLKAKTEAVSIWLHYEPYLCLLAGVLVGGVLEHFFRL